MTGGFCLAVLNLLNLENLIFTGVFIPWALCAPFIVFLC